MKISWGNSAGQALWAGNGYGYATKRIMESLRRLGHEVDYDDPTADVHFHFDQPQHFKVPKKGMYSVMYHPWESTELKPGWADMMNTADEVWTPSPLIAEWYTKISGVTRPVHVFEHGVDADWQPVERTVDGPFKFLHIGAEASRKGGKEAMSAFIKAFPNRKDIELDMKIIQPGWNVGRINRINIINDNYSFEQLLDLYASHHAFVYPSYGEGFGLTPLQALATGMPTLTVPNWAPYADFLEEDLSLRSNFCRSPWPVEHPGLMLKPNEGDLVEAMRAVVDNYEEYHRKALDRVDELTSHYNWDRLTKEAFSDLEHRLRSF